MNKWFLLLIIFCHHGYANDVHTDLALEYIEITKVLHRFDEGLQECLDSFDPTLPEKLVEKNEYYFGGLTPNFDKWPLAVKLYETFHIETCHDISKEEVIDIYVTHYTEGLSIDELKDAIAFSKTKTGKKIIEVDILADTVYLNKWEESYEASVKQARTNFNDGVRLLEKEYFKTKKVYLSNFFVGKSHKSMLQSAAQSSVLRANIISYDDELQTERYKALAQTFLEKGIPVTSVYRMKKRNTSGAGVICNSTPLGKADTIEQLESLLSECEEKLKTAKYLGEEKLENISVDW